MAVADIPQVERRPTRSRRGLGRWRGRAIVAVQGALLTLLIAGWQFGVSDAGVPYFSRPSLVAAKLVELLSQRAIYDHIAVTFTEIALGYALGAIVGLVGGYALGRSPFWSEALQPFVMGLYSIPKIALAPVFIVWLGLGMASKVAVVFLSSFFLIFSNTYSGLVAVNEELVNLARLMGASWRHVIARVILPAASGQIFIGLKTAVPYAVIGEYIGSNEGLGYFILYASQTYDAPSLFAGIAILVAIVFLANAALSWIERRTIRWKRGGRAAVQL